MPRKNSDARLNEAIAFIRNTPVASLTPGFRNDLHLELMRWKRVTPAGTQAQISALMSQARAAHRPAAQQNRQYRRSSILLRCAIVNSAPASWPGHVTAVNTRQPDYVTTYAASVRTAVDTYYSRPAMTELLLQALMQNPAVFLRRYKLSVGGQGQSRAEDYGVYMFQQTIRMLIPWEAPRYRLTVIKVGTTSWLRVANGAGPLHPIAGTNTADYPGLNIMLTTQFTGCTYCFMKNAAGTEVIAAHIDPGTDLDGRELPRLHGSVPRPGVQYAFAGADISAALRAGGSFANPNGGVFRAHGRNLAAAHAREGYGDGRVIILGLKRSGVWEIWRQLQTEGGLEVARIDT